MKDYKELIAELRTHILAPPRQTTTIEQQAADAIVQLIKERDAAISDIPHICQTCYGNNMEADCVDNPCWNCKGNNNPEWEWRGLQEVEHGND